MFTAFLFIGVFCFYCCIYNGMEGNKVAPSAGTKADKNQELKLSTIAPESFVPTPPQSKAESLTESTNKLTDDITGVSDAETLPDVSDPWTLPVDENIVTAAPPHHNSQQHQPLLLLPPAMSLKAERSRPTTSRKLTPLQLLTEIDLDTLQLRKARKIAKELGISQKVNGRDQSLGFLKSQIKSKLQQCQSLPPKTVEIVRELLVS